MKKIAVVYSDYYPEIVSPMIQLFKMKAKQNNDNWDIFDFRVFGTFELPLMVKQKIQEGYDAVAVFGCVIKGKTFHHELINLSVVPKLLDLSVDNSVPIGVSVLTVKSYRQAVSRSKGTDNRGSEAYESIKSFLG